MTCVSHSVRFVALLAISLWLGADIFFAFAVAPVAFATLAPFPDGRALAADIVGRDLTILHWLGLVCGAALLSCILSMRLGRLISVIVAAMMALTALSQFAVTPQVHALRISHQTASVSFARLHMLSTALEAVVILLGLWLLFLLSRGLTATSERL